MLNFGNWIDYNFSGESSVHTAILYALIFDLIYVRTREKLDSKAVCEKET